MRMFFETIKERVFSEQERWFSWGVVLFAAGIGFYFVFPFEPSLYFSLIFLAATLIAAVFCRNKYLFLIPLVVLLGFLNIQLKAKYLSLNYLNLNEDKTMYLTGRVTDMDYSYQGKVRLMLSDMKDFDENAVEGNFRLNLNAKKTNIEVGQCVELIATLKPPLKPVIVDGYQFNRKYFFDGISANGFVQGRALLVDCAQSFGLIHKIRSKVVERIFQILPQDEARVSAAIVAGEKGKIGEKLYNQYRDSGLAHFLSISGLHMAMVAGLMFFLVRLIIAMIPALALRFDGKKTASVFAALMSFCYLLISGMEIPAQRAFIMTLIMLIGVLFARRAISMKTISWAALFILIISPQVLIGVSFQMSFAAVVCLIAFYERFASSLSKFLKTDGKLWILKVIFAYFIGILLSDLVASLATLPFAIYHFNRIAIYTTLGNLAAGPVIGLVIMPAVVMSLILMPFGLDYYPLRVLGWGINKINEITHYVANLPEARHQVLAMPFWGLLLIIFGTLWLCLWEKNWRKFGWIGIIMGFLSMFLVNNPDIIKGNGITAVKDNSGNLIILPVRGKNFEKKIWLEKTASRPLSKTEYAKLKKIYKGEIIDKSWVDLECKESVCFYKGLNLNEFPDGSSVRIKNDKVEIKTIDEYIGDRYWK